MALFLVASEQLRLMRGIESPNSTKMDVFLHIVKTALDPPSVLHIHVADFSDGLLKSGLQNDTNLQHKFLHMGLTPPPPFTQCVKKHPLW